MPRPIADLHCHYPMHLLAEEGGGDPYVQPLREIKKRRLWHKIRAILVRLAAKRLNFGRSGKWRVDLDGLAAGDVRLVFSVLYVPEAELGIEEWVSGRPGEDSFKDLIEQLEEVNADLGERKAEGGPANLVVRKAAELEGASGDGDGVIRIVHCIEGGFHLGADAAAIDGRVKQLAEAGVGYITLAHLFWRHVATNAPALPNLSDGLYDFLFGQPDDVGLTEIGEAAVRAMYRYGVLVDISHMRLRAIEETLALLAELDDREGRQATEYPVIATHAGYRFGEHSYMLDAETIRAIAGRGGVVGLIMAHHLLNDGLTEDRDGIVQTMRSVRLHIGKIHELTGSYENIGIGSDLDGFIKPTVGGIEKARHLQRLAEHLGEAYPAHAAAMLHDNALRVLEAAYARRAEAGIGTG
jgi:microsomal dipeptidase-like Zn-dependent dipeptidase